MSNQVATAPEFLYSVQDLSNDVTTILNYPALVRGFYVNTAVSAATILKDGTTSVFTIPAGTVAGTTVPLYDVTFQSKLIIDPDDSATGSITVIYKPTGQY